MNQPKYRIGEEVGFPLTVSNERASFVTTVPLHGTIVGIGVMHDGRYRYDVCREGKIFRGIAEDKLKADWEDKFVAAKDPTEEINRLKGLVKRLDEDLARAYAEVVKLRGHK